MKYTHLLWKTAFLILGCIFSFSTFAQFGKQIHRGDHDDKPYYFGLTLGYANTNLAYTKTQRFLDYDSVLSIAPGFSPSFCLGLLATFHPYGRWEFRVNPQLLLGANRSLQYNLAHPLPGESFVETKTVQSTLVSFPFSAKFNSDRLSNFRAYMLGGVQFDMDLASNAKSSNADDLLKLKKFDYGVHFGIGCNLYLPFVTVSPEIKFVWGLSNLHSPTPTLKYSNTIDQLNSRMIIFSLHLEE